MWSYRTTSCNHSPSIPNPGVNDYRIRLRYAGNLLLNFLSVGPDQQSLWKSNSDWCTITMMVTLQDLDFR